MRSGPRGHTSPGSPSDTAFLSGCVGRMSVTSSSATVAVLRLSIGPGYASAGFGTRRWHTSVAHVARVYKDVCKFREGRYSGH